MGERDGSGTLLSQGCRVNAIWQGDRTIGPAQIIYADGRIYKGRLNEEIEMEGEGELTFSTGTVCKGRFEKDEFVKGTLYYKNGEIYEGQALNFRRHGKGVYYYADGRIV